MKIRKNHIHLFILLFAVSSLLVHSPPEAFAAEEGDITAVRAKILGNHLEHHGDGAWTSLGLDGDELPGYVKHLAQWVVEDKIDLADLIIAVEYIINVK